MKPPTAADWIAYARLMNGECPKCKTINKRDGTPRCPCADSANTSSHPRGDR